MVRRSRALTLQWRILAAPPPSARILTLSRGLAAQQPPPRRRPSTRRRPRRLVIKNAMVIYGNAKPPYGPVDIVVRTG